jgi:glycosyltransferase involved in cell wall biosynthesis
MAGSEVYTFNLTREQAKTNEVYVFTRIEDASKEAYHVIDERIDGIQIRRINRPHKERTLTARYLDERTDEMFREYLGSVAPDIVHIDHLSHLSTNIAIIAKEEFGHPVAFTLHDYWLLCSRGQLITGDLEICPGPKVADCAGCLKRWTKPMDAQQEIEARNRQMDKVISTVDMFIAPSRFLNEIFIDHGMPRERIVYSDYGFDISLFDGISRKPSDHLRIGYIGTHIPTKGLHVLIEAFNRLQDTEAELLIYGQRTKNTETLERLCENPNIQFMGGYPNWKIGGVLSRLDTIIVPSVWYENSPLVIHEAFLAKMPVITSNRGGMAELVSHMENGLLFELGSDEDLEDKLRMLIDDPGLAKRLGDNTPMVKSIHEDAQYLQGIYEGLVGNGQDE